MHTSQSISRNPGAQSGSPTPASCVRSWSNGTLLHMLIGSDALTCLPGNGANALTCRTRPSLNTLTHAHYAHCVERTSEPHCMSAASATVHECHCSATGLGQMGGAVDRKTVLHTCRPPMHCSLTSVADARIHTSQSISRTPGAQCKSPTPASCVKSGGVTVLCSTC